MWNRNDPYQHFQTDLEKQGHQPNLVEFILSNKIDILILSSHVKYLGVILVSKITSRLDIELRIQNVCIAFYACKRIFARKWGLPPNMVLLAHTAMMRPILTYGSIVRWKTLSKKYNRTKLKKLKELRA